MYDSSLGSPTQNQSNEEQPKENEKKEITTKKQKEKSPQKDSNKQQENSPQKDINKQQDKEENQQQKEENVQEGNSFNDHNNENVNLPNNQAEINIDEQQNKANDVLNIDDIDINNVDESKLTADQVLMLKTKLVLNNISDQQLITLIAYTKEILHEPKGCECPFMNETTLEQAIFRLNAEGLFERREVRWSDTKWKDYGLYLLFHGIRVVGEIMVKNQEIIDSTCKILGWITDVLKLLNPAVGLTGMIADKITSYAKNQAYKKVMDQYGFILSEKYNEYVYKFATKSTKDDRVTDEIIQACKLIPIIVKKSVKIISAVSGIHDHGTAAAINNRDVFPMKSVKDVTKIRVYTSSDRARDNYVKNTAKLDKDLMKQAKLLKKSSNDTPKHESTSPTPSTSFNFTQEMPETKFHASDYNTKYSFSTTAPKSSATVPQSSTTVPKSSATAPQSSTTAPKSSATAPQSSTTAPKSSATAPQSSTAAPKSSATVSQSSTTKSSLKAPKDYTTFSESGFVKGYNKTCDPHHFDLPIKKTVPPYRYFRKMAAEEAKNPQPSLDIPSEITTNNSPLKGMNNRLQNSSDVQSPIPPYQSKTDKYYEAWKAGLLKK